MANPSNNILQLLRVLYPWRKKISLVTLVFFVASIIGSLLTPNYYKATSTFYVASPDQAMPNNIGEEEREKRFYGNDSDIDRILAIGSSAELKQEMIKQFNLFEHYEIDSASKRAEFKVMNEFESNFALIKNKYDALELSIEDQNPDQVADMVNHCRYLIEQKAISVIKQNQQKQLTDIRNNIGVFEKEVQKISADLEEIQTTYQIYNTETQSESLSKLLTENIAEKSKLEVNNPGSDRLKGVNNTIERIKNMLNTYAKGFPKYERTLTAYEEATNQLVKENERYKQLKSVFEAEVPVALVIEHGQKPTIKSRPRRSLIVLAATLIGFIVAVIGALLFEQYRHLDWNYIKKKD